MLPLLLGALLWHSLGRGVASGDIFGSWVGSIDKEPAVDSILLGQGWTLELQGAVSWASGVVGLEEVGS